MTNVVDVFERALSTKRIVIDDLGALNTKTNRYIGYTRSETGTARRITWYDKETKKRWKISLSSLALIEKHLLNKT